jgi:uncharacterized protein
MDDARAPDAGRSDAEGPVDRLGLEVLTTDECWELITATPVGRVAFVDAGEPLILPVTHTVRDHQVVFRSAPGTKLAAAEMNVAVAFEVDGWDESSRRGWSVLVRGMGETVYDADDLDRFEAIGNEPWMDAAKGGTWVRILASEVTGRRLPS